MKGENVPLQYSFMCLCPHLELISKYKRCLSLRSTPPLASLHYHNFLSYRLWLYQDKHEDNTKVLDVVCFIFFLCFSPPTHTRNMQKEGTRRLHNACTQKCSFPSKRLSPLICFLPQKPLQDKQVWDLMIPANQTPMQVCTVSTADCPQPLALQTRGSGCLMELPNPHRQQQNCVHNQAAVVQ